MTFESTLKKQTRHQCNLTHMDTYIIHTIQKYILCSHLHAAMETDSECG